MIPDPSRPRGGRGRKKETAMPEIEIDSEIYNYRIEVWGTGEAVRPMESSDFRWIYRNWIELSEKYGHGHVTVFEIRKLKMK